MTEENAEVIIDSREPEEMIIAVSNHSEVGDWFVDEREYGDLIINDSVAIERKTPSDFSSSVLDDRIKIQAKGLMESDYRGYILVEGTIDDIKNLKHSNLHENAIRGVMASITVRYGIPVIPVGNLESLVDLAVRMGRKATEEETSPVLESGAIESRDAPTLVRMYACIPGIGQEAAWNLFSQYPSLEAILNASVEDLVEVPQVGERRAEAVQGALRGDSKETENKSWTTK